VDEDIASTQTGIVYEVYTLGEELGERLVGGVTRNNAQVGTVLMNTQKQPLDKVWGKRQNQSFINWKCIYMLWMQQPIKEWQIFKLNRI